MSKEEQVYYILKFNEDLKRKRKGEEEEDGDCDVKKKKGKFEDGDFGDLKKVDVDGDEGDGVALEDSSSGLEDVKKKGKFDDDFNKQGDLKKGDLDQDKGGVAQDESSSFGGGGVGVEDVKKKKGKFDEDDEISKKRLLEFEKKYLEEEEYDDDDDDEDEDEDDEDEDEDEDEEAVSEEDEEAAAEKKEVEKRRISREKLEEFEVEPEQYCCEISEERKNYYQSDQCRNSFYYIRNRGREKGDTAQQYHTMSEEEYKIYHQVIEESEGFDVPFMPFALMFGKLIPVNLGCKKRAMYIAKLSKLALKYCNEKHSSNYVLKRIEKANVGSSCVATYYITFWATDVGHPDRIETFQAKVNQGFRYDVAVLMCRIKPTAAP